MKKLKIITVLLLMIIIVIFGRRKEQNGLQAIALVYNGNWYIEKGADEVTEALYSIKAEHLGTTSSELYNGKHNLSFEEIWEQTDYENTKQIPALFSEMEVYSIKGYSPEAYLLARHTNGSISLFSNTNKQVALTDRYPLLADLNKISEMTWCPDPTDPDIQMSFGQSEAALFSAFIKELYDAEYMNDQDIDTYINREYGLLSITFGDGFIAEFKLYSDGAIQDAATDQLISLPTDAVLNIKQWLQSNDSKKYGEFLTRNYSPDSIKVIMADLTHDNHDEMIVLETLDSDLFTGIMHILHISDDGDVIEIYRDDVGEAQAGWRWYYLYKDPDNKDYLIQYVPGIFGGSGVFSLYTVSFSPDGSYKKDEIANVIYDTTHFNEEQQKNMYEELEVFKELLFRYINSSKQLIAVGSDVYLLNEDTIFFGEDIGGYGV